MLGEAPEPYVNLARLRDAWGGENPEHMLSFRHDPYIHDTLLKAYVRLLESRNFSGMERKGRDAEEYSRVVGSYRLAGSRVLFLEETPEGKLHEFDALLRYRYGSKDHYVLVNFKLNGHRRKDFEHFRQTCLYDDIMEGGGELFFVTVRPRYRRDPESFGEDMTPAFLPENIEGFYEQVHKEKKHSRRKKHRGFYRLNHRYQRF